MLPNAISRRAILLQRSSVFRSMAPCVSRNVRALVMRIVVFEVRVAVDTNGSTAH
jgi:hypothetical protein